MPFDDFCKQFDQIDLCDRSTGFRDLTLQVQGPSLGRWIWVKDWTLLADRSGWTPFVGPLRVEGVQVFLEDRATGSVLILEGPAAQILRSGDGELALVTGYVSGAHRIQVLEARILDRPAEP